MAKNGMRRAARRPSREVSRYSQKSLRRDREYGFYWYAWLWRALRPALVLLCSLVVVIGIVVSGWNYLYGQFFMPVDPGDPTTVDFTIEKGTSITKIGNALYEQKLVRNKGIFKYIIQFKGLTGKIQYGSYPLARDMDVNEVIEALTAGSASNERTITIIPGWTIEDIAEYLFAQKAIPAKEDFLKLANDLPRFKDSSYTLQNAVQLGTMEGRKYQLEGYLAPDTYRVYTNATPEAIMLTLLQQAEVVLDDVFNAGPVVEIVRDEQGNIIEGGAAEPTEDETAENVDSAPEETVAFTTTLNKDQTVVLASIIEREAGKKSDYAKVAAVFHNRIERGMRLESDATASYPLGINRLILTADELSSVNGYNTYTRDGLPVGPICNPSKDALRAALYPDLDYVYEGYLYFCTADPETGALAFAKTKEEHQANISKYRALWMAYDQKQAARNE